MSRARFTCATCAHEGCCDEPCGGSHWTSAFAKCPNCGEEFRDDGDWQSEDGKSFCSEQCLGEYEAKQQEEEQ